MVRKQRNFLNTLSTSIVGMLMLIVTYQAQAGIITADVYFTLRSTSQDGPADLMGELGDTNGILGLLTNSESSQIDHTQWEFDMSMITGPVSSATLDWSWSGSQNRDDVVFVDAYSADGLASLDDWLTAAGAAGSFPAADPATPVNLAASFDITSVINANLTESYLGFSFSIDPVPGQGFFGSFSDPMTLNFTNVPEPGTLVLMTLGLAWIGFKRR